MFNFFKRNKKNIQQNKKDKSSLIYDNHGERFLKIRNDCCGMILYPDNNVEIIFTKLYDPETQKITLNEESLMALGVFIKQPGFLEMLRNEFRRIAMEKINDLTDNKE